jgi:hypothetical protein
LGFWQKGKFHISGTYPEYTQNQRWRNDNTESIVPHINVQVSYLLSNPLNLPSVYFHDVSLRSNAFISYAGHGYTYKLRLHGLPFGVTPHDRPVCVGRLRNPSREFIRRLNVGIAANCPYAGAAFDGDENTTNDGKTGNSTTLKRGILLSQTWYFMG